MKKLIFIICLLITVINIDAQQKDFSKLTGLYLGQKPPEMTPKIFAPEILSVDKYPHGHLTFSKDEKTIYWSAYPKGKSNQTIFFSTFDGKKLTYPVRAIFAADSGNGGPAISYDGKRLFFNAELPSISAASRKTFVICYVEQVEGSWSKPIIIESTIDTVMTKGQVSVSKNGNIYFSGRMFNERTPTIFICKYENGKYLKPEKLTGPITELPLLVDPWIDPEERFLLCSFPGESGPPMLTDIGISYKQSDNTWSKPNRIGGEVNTNHFERFPSLSPDGRFLFFIRSINSRFVGEGAHFYWVSTKIIVRRTPSGKS
jgi:outer membrane protein assembly factor BamB